MNKFINYCTGEQTKRAIKLGAPIYPTCYGDGFTHQIYYDDQENKLTGKSYYDIPTTQQMIGWLREKGCIFNLYYCDYGYDYQVEFGLESTDKHTYSINYEQAELAAIDAALGYLEKVE